MMRIQETINERISRLEGCGFIEPNCKTCQKIFYPALLKGVNIVNIFAPRHKALDSCQSGKNPHCTCDSCF